MKHSWRDHQLLNDILRTNSEQTEKTMGHFTLARLRLSSGFSELSLQCEQGSARIFSAGLDISELQDVSISHRSLFFDEYR